MAGWDRVPDQAPASSGACLAIRGTDRRFEPPEAFDPADYLDGGRVYHADTALASPAGSSSAGRGSPKTTGAWS